MNNNTELKIFAITLLITIMVAPATWVFKSHMEAKAYNRLTGADATTWEAMWTELRVTGNPTDQ